MACTTSGAIWCSATRSAQPSASGCDLVVGGEAGRRRTRRTGASSPGRTRGGRRGRRGRSASCGRRRSTRRLPAHRSPCSRAGGSSAAAEPRRAGRRAARGRRSLGAAERAGRRAPAGRAAAAAAWRRTRPTSRSGSLGRPRLPVVRRSSRPKHGAPARCSAASARPSSASSCAPAGPRRSTPARGRPARRRRRRTPPAPRARRPRPARASHAAGGLGGEEPGRWARVGLGEDRRPSSSSTRKASATSPPCTGLLERTSAPSAAPSAEDRRSSRTSLQGNIGVIGAPEPATSRSRHRRGAPSPRVLADNDHHGRRVVEAVAARRGWRMPRSPSTSVRPAGSGRGARQVGAARRLNPGGAPFGLGQQPRSGARSANTLTSRRRLRRRSWNSPGGWPSGR